MFDDKTFKLTNSKEYHDIFKREKYIYEELSDILYKGVYSIEEISSKIGIKNEYIEILLLIWEYNRYTFNEYGRIYKLHNNKWKLLKRDDIFYDKSEGEIVEIYS